MAHRVGDVLRISCPFTPTVVTRVDDTHVSVRWPWWEIDPDADGIRWNGEAALGRDDGIALNLELVFRPYAFLEPGDDVADADGRAWRFDGPWTWTAYDGSDGVPAWPLTMLAGDARPAAVAAATAAGSHETEVAHWWRAAGVHDRARPR
jgi:hypothetical protein